MIREVVTFSALAAKDILGILPRKADDSEHLRAAVDWLKRAHDQHCNDGVSYGYSIFGGWRPAYRETTGYIASTFFDLATYYGANEYKERAVRMCRWLLSVQNPDGSFSNPRYGDSGIVFDTGQDLFGLVRAYEETLDPEFIKGALKAGRWLANIADSSGIWTNNEHLGVPHVYNTRSAWALLRLNEARYDANRDTVARANLDWAVREQQSSGFFDNCSFARGRPPFTHTIAYTTRGLLEAGTLLKEQRYVASAVKCADATLKHIESNGFLPGEISIDGDSKADYCCMTGNCQFSIIWMKLFFNTGDERYRDGAFRALDYVASRHDTYSANLDIKGAVKGSHPIWCKYAPMSFPNWAAKFFIDAIILRSKCKL